MSISKRIRESIRMGLLKLVLVSLCWSFAQAAEISPELVIDGFVDVDRCYRALIAADQDPKDRMIGAEEYVTFVQRMGPPGTDFLGSATTFTDLPLVLKSNFIVLACRCAEEGGDEDCCVGDNAMFSSVGANPSDVPSNRDQSNLFLSCYLTAIAVDRVLESEAPTPMPSSSPTTVPSIPPSPAPSISTSPSASPTPRVLDRVVKATYQIAVERGMSEDTPVDDLVGSMNSLAPEVLIDLESVRRRLRWQRRRLQSVQIPTFVDGYITIECPPAAKPSDRCEEVSASIKLLFQGDDEDAADEFADIYLVALEAAILRGDLQEALDNFNPFSPAYILTGLDSDTSGDPPFPPDSRPVETVQGGRIAGIVIGAVVIFALAGLLVAKRRSHTKDEFDNMQPVPQSSHQLDDGADEEVFEPKSKLPATLGAAAPDYGKHPQKISDKTPMHTPFETRTDEDEYDKPEMDHDSSSNAGSSGWSSSAGVSSLNTGSADGLDNDPVVGIAPGSTLASIGAASRPPRETVPSVTRADLDSAIEAGDWAAVGATAALLAAASDSQSYSSKSGHMSGTPSRSGSSVSSLDAARAAELDHLVDAGDWEGVVLAAAKYEAAEGQFSRTTESADSGGSRSGSMTGSGTYPSVATSGSQTSSPSKSTSKSTKRQELRQQVEDLVRRVVPEEIQNVDEMMLQFRGREEELVETLRTMQERAVAQKARQGAQKAAKQQAKRTASETRAAAASSSSVPSSKRRTSPDASDPQEVGATGESGSFPIENTQKPPADREQRQSALETAIESGDWEAVGDAAAMMSDRSVTTADTDEINRLAAGNHSDASAGGDTEDRAAELDELIDKGDWTGVVAAASRFSEDDQAPAKKKGGWLKKKEPPSEPEIDEERAKEIEAKRQRRLKRLQEEQDALAQAEIWMAIAEQSKQDTKQEAKGASDAADWAIARSLSLLVQAEQGGRLQEANQPPQLETQQEEGEEENEEAEEEV